MPEHFKDKTKLKTTTNEQGQTAPQSLLQRAGARFYTLVIMIALLVPLVAMAIKPTNASVSNSELAPFPQLMGSSGINTAFAQDSGRYFEDHFAYRNELIDLNSRLLKRLFLTSATEKVILGKDGWLYYQGTLDDYQKTHLMSERALFNAAHNIALAQEFVEAHNATFVMSFVPDKNALYPEHMPYQLPPTQGLTNAQQIEQQLDIQGVRWLDLRPVLQGNGEVLYLERDSHWTDTGALLAYNALMERAALPHHDFTTSQSYESQHFGDLDTMLTPLSAQPETQLSYKDAEQFTYVEPVESLEASSIHTTGNLSDAQGRVLMFRDSFGNALLPFFASSTEEAFFSKKIPYDLGLMELYKPNLVVFERTERHASTFATNPPYMDSPTREVPASYESIQSSTTAELRFNGPYLQIDGSIDTRYLGPTSLVYVELTSSNQNICVDAFLVSSITEQVSDVDEIALAGSDEIEGDCGFRGFINRARYPIQKDALHVRVFVIGDNNAMLVLDKEIVITDSER